MLTALSGSCLQPTRLLEGVGRADFEVAADGAGSVHRVEAHAAVGQRVQRRDLDMGSPESCLVNSVALSTRITYGWMGTC